MLGCLFCYFGFPLDVWIMKASSYPPDTCSESFRCFKRLTIFPSFGLWKVFSSSLFSCLFPRSLSLLLVLFFSLLLCFFHSFLVTKASECSIFFLPGPSEWHETRTSLKKNGPDAFHWEERLRKGNFEIIKFKIKRTELVISVSLRVTIYKLGLFTAVLVFCEDEWHGCR